MTELYRGPERRHFVRLEYVTPLAYKICNKETIARLLQGYVSNVSEAGLLCNITERVDRDDILWLSFNRDTLGICQEMEKRSLIYQNGIIGKVVHVEQKEDNTYNVGINFITREEQTVRQLYIKDSLFDKEKLDGKT